MSVPAPHFLLFSESRTKRKEAKRESERESGQTVGHWRFVLESLDGSEKFEADDEEPLAQGDRLELLAVVRGLEALDQPSRVTLVTPSRYVSRGLRFGLEQWRESGWLWERFGQMAPVKNRDLWQRVDRALDFHEIECRTWQFDQGEESDPAEAGPPTCRTGFLARLARPGKAVLRNMRATWSWCRANVGRVFNPSRYVDGLKTRPANPRAADDFGARHLAIASPK